MRLTKWAARLYPRWWRERYGEEFAALLEDARPGFFGVLDVARGAMAMQMTTWPAKRIVALGVLVGLVGGLGVALRRPTYESAVVLSSTAPMDKDAIYATAVANAFTRERLVNIVRKSSLYPDERNRMALEDVMSKMRGDLSVVPRLIKADGVHQFEIRFRYSDEVLSKKTAMDLGTSFIEQARASGIEIQELSAPSPTKRVFSNVGKFAGAGSFGGLVVTGLFALGLVVGRRQVSAKQE